MAVKIDLEDVADWMAMLSSIDGQISPREEKLLALFEDTYGLRSGHLISLAKKKVANNEKEVQLIDRNTTLGYEFEKFVVRLLCADDCPFELLAWRSDKKVDGIFAKDSLMPDLRLIFRTKSAHKSILVECKYRQDPANIARIAKKTLMRYKAHAQRCGCPVVLALGAGGTATDPECFTIVTLEEFIQDPSAAMSQSVRLSREEAISTLINCIKE
ncbi:MAG: hypothetical protein K2I18_03635 [Paramuribaculum sp.]|nr:hypothetical protein [Paramuribaculum sp.]